MAEDLAKKKNATTGERLVALLRTIEARCLQYAVGLPQQTAVEESWEGVVFSIAGRQYVARMQEISEILNYPQHITRVPGTLPWVIGIANIRGNLLPIIDLQSFLLGRQTVRDRRSRVLVINHKEICSGLLTDSFVGIKRFLQSQKSAAAPKLQDNVMPYVNDVYEQIRDVDPNDDTGGSRMVEVWPVFDMHKLAESEDFKTAAPRSQLA